jgi:undecaprenyl-diphosphatase
MDFLRLLEGIRTPFFNGFFQFFTLFGEETLFMVAAMIFFWCIDKKSGYFLLYVSFLGATINQFLKLIFCVPRRGCSTKSSPSSKARATRRPAIRSPAVTRRRAAGLFLGIARFRRETWIRIVCVVLTLLVGFSRMYLGVHTPADVLVSLGIALLLVMVGYPLFYRAWNNKNWFFLLMGLLLLTGVALLLYVECVPLPANAIAEFSADGAKTAYVMFGSSVGLALVLWL